MFWKNASTRRAQHTVIAVLALLSSWAVDAATPASPGVDINHAPAITISTQLPGIGPTRAQAIVNYRLKHGPFQFIEELLQIQGIGPATLARIRDRVRLEPLEGSGSGAASDSESPTVGGSAEARAREAVRAVVRRALQAGAAVRPATTEHAVQLADRPHPCEATRTDSANIESENDNVSAFEC